MVERLPVKERVVGSNPTRGAKTKISDLGSLILVSSFVSGVRTEGRNH